MISYSSSYGSSYSSSPQIVPLLVLDCHVREAVPNRPVVAIFSTDQSAAAFQSTDPLNRSPRHRHPVDHGHLPLDTAPLWPQIHSPVPASLPFAISLLLVATNDSIGSLRLVFDSALVAVRLFNLIPSVSVQ